jgi:hypothetical protein
MVDARLPLWSRRSTWTLLAALVISGFAAALRGSGLDFGRGVQAVPDEGSVLFGLSSLDKGMVHPLLVLYGGGYFLPLYAFVKLWGWLASWTGPLADTLASDPFPLKMAVRTWSALLSTATVWITFVVGRRLGGGSAGLLASALLAAFPLAVREAHFAKADSAAMFAAALLMWVMTRSGKNRTGAVCAISAAGALALCTKANFGVLPALVYALMLEVRSSTRGVDRRLALYAIGVFAGVVLLLNSISILSPALVWAYVQSTARVLSSTDWLPGGDAVPGPLVYHATISLRYGLGAAVAGLAAPALVFGLWRPGPTRSVALLVIGQWLALLTSPMVLARFFLLCAPGLAVLIALLVTRCIDRVTRDRFWRTCLPLLAGALLLVEPLCNAVTLAKLLRRTDTRVLAGEWIAEKVPAGARIVSWGARKKMTDYGRPPMEGRKIYALAARGNWEALRITHVVHHSHPLPYSDVPLPSLPRTAQSLAVFDPFDGPLNRPVFEPLLPFYIPLARFGGIARPGPRIEIFAVSSETQ